jgi:poly-gamma-glutamate synthesis protein (capsule biosynthesis protein)
MSVIKMSVREEPLYIIPGKNEMRTVLSFHMKVKLLLICLPVLCSITLLAEPAFSGKITSRDQMSYQIKIFMCGDVMTGRGIDQVLPHPVDPLIHEPYMKSAGGYVELAEAANGPIKQPVGFSYTLGDAIEELERMSPDLRIINLETSITKSNDYWKGKSIHYRMHPDNISCIALAKIDYCSLANNHVLDWGYSGLMETLETLKKVNVKTAGAGRNLREAETPAVITVEGKGRVIVFSYGSTTSRIPIRWAASNERPGVNLLKDLSDKTVRYIKGKVTKIKQPGDIVVVSIHWGSNWGYDIPPDDTDFAHKLIDDAGVDVIHGHSSHHVKGIEVYNDRLIIYGAGDFLNDYEGIPGYEDFRDDLGLMYFVSIDSSTGKLIQLQMTPTYIRNFKVNRAAGADVLWLRDILNREGKKFRTRVKANRDNTLMLHWD